MAAKLPWAAGLWADTQAVFSGHVLKRGLGPRQEIVDAAVGVAVDDLGDHVGKIDVWIDAVEFAGFD